MKTLRSRLQPVIQSALEMQSHFIKRREPSKRSHPKRPSTQTATSDATAVVFESPVSGATRTLGDGAESARSCIMQVRTTSVRRRKAARRKKRGLVAALGGLAMCAVLPASVFQIVLYRQNLAMARERFSTGPTFHAHDRLLIIAPHCDDETLGAGGTIAAARRAGAAVRVVFMTNGDGSRSTRIVEDARRPADFLLRRNTFQKLAHMRQQEALAALHELGVRQSNVLFLGYPDGGTQALWENHWTPDDLYRSPYTGADHSPYANSRTPRAAYCGAQVLRDVTAVIDEWQPTAILTTHPSDTHPDHWASYAFSNAALETLRLRAGTQQWARGVRLLTFLVHHGVWPVPHGYHPEAGLSPPAALKDIGTHWMQVPLAETARAAKAAALEHYVSQLAFTPQYLRSFLRRNELFGVVPPLEREIGAAPPIGKGPVSIQPSAFSPHHARPELLIQDPTRDSLLNDVWPAADIKTISLATAANPATLVLRVQLAQAPSRRLRYQLALHTVNGATERAAVIRVQRRGAAVHAVWNTSSTELPARLTATGFEVDVPHSRLGLSRGAGVLLLSASTHLGNSRLDQTATGTLRLAHARPVAPRYPGPVRVLTD